MELKEIAAGCGAVLPKPGSGGTPTRFGALADWAARDLSLARLAEGHVDALAILAEADLEPNSGATYGVWAARPRAGGATAYLAADGWHVSGVKPFCSGGTRIDRALVTAECEDGYSDGAALGRGAVYRSVLAADPRVLSQGRAQRRGL